MRQTERVPDADDERVADVVTSVTVAELRGMVGETIGTSDWLTIDQASIDAFADATLDHQWIHIDAQRAATGPFGMTIAHGYLTLSLCPFFLSQIFDVRDTRMTINYGLDRVRFPAPVPVGSRIRGTAELVSCEPVGEGEQTVIRVTVETERGPKPVCVAELVARFYT